MQVCYRPPIKSSLGVMTRGEVVECQLVRFVVARNHQCGTSRPIVVYSPTGKNSYAKQTPSETPQSCSFLHTALRRPLRPARACSRSLVRPSHRQFANLSKGRLRKCHLGEGGECGIALMLCPHACMHTAAGFASCASLLLIACMQICLGVFCSLICWS